MTEKTILLAEDDPGHEALIRRALKRAGNDLEIAVVHDGVEVLDYLFATGKHAGRDSSRMPHLILLDLKMPRMGGLQVLQVLRRVRGDQRTSLPPVVILTSSSEDLDVVNAYQLGAHSFIHKPVDFDKLTDMIAQIVEYWLTVNESPPVVRTSTGIPGSKYVTKFRFDEHSRGGREEA